jgi:hypothetical protein
MSTGPRPKVAYKTECVKSSTTGVKLVGKEARIALNVPEDDVSYFVVGREYVASFDPAASDDSGGGDENSQAASD